MLFFWQYESDGNSWFSRKFQISMAYEGVSAGNQAPHRHLTSGNLSTFQKEWIVFDSPTARLTVWENVRRLAQIGDGLIHSYVSSFLRADPLLLYAPKLLTFIPSFIATFHLWIASSSQDGSLCSCTFFFGLHLGLWIGSHLVVCLSIRHLQYLSHHFQSFD